MWWEGRGLCQSPEESRIHCYIYIYIYIYTYRQYMDLWPRKPLIATVLDTKDFGDHLEFCKCCGGGILAAPPNPPETREYFEERESL